MTDFIAGLIDVFADGPLRGNPLAVVEGGDGLEDDLLRRIAREFNQAETTFIMASKRADRRLRSFTASGAEVFGAGHNALGAWLWLGHGGDLGDLARPRTFRQEIGDEVLPIEVENRDGRIHGRMTQSSLKLLAPLDNVATLAESLGLQTDDVAMHPAARPADTGAAHLMVRLRDAQTVDRAEPAAAQLLEVLKQVGAEGCYCYAFDPATPGVAYARFFNPTVGLWEDSATGTAAGPLCAYLGSEGLLAADRRLVVEQGTRMGRQSFLSLRLNPEAELSGAGVVVLRGTLHI